MTPLMQAAYKGDVDMCELLLAHGADVNSNFHEHEVHKLVTFMYMYNNIVRM